VTECLLIALNFLLFTQIRISASMNWCHFFNKLLLKITGYLTPMIMFTIPFKYLLETIHWDWPSIALDYNYLQDQYKSRTLNSDDDLKLSFLLVTILLVCIKEYFLLIMILNIQDWNHKSAFLSKGVKRGVFPQTIYFFHHIAVWIVLTLLVFFSTSASTFTLLGINLGFQLFFTAIHFYKIFDNFLLYV